MTEEKKAKLKKVAKYTGIGLGAVVLGYFGYKYVTADNGPSEEAKKLADDLCNQIEEAKELEHSKGYDQAIVDMMNFCQENGKSIVGTYSSKGFGEENAEYWLVAELLDKKPDLPDILVDSKYTIATHQ